MNQQEVDGLINAYQEKLALLQPTLHPHGGKLPYTKIGLLNLARKRQETYTKNIHFLKLVRQDPSLMPDDVIHKMLGD